VCIPWDTIQDVGNSQNNRVWFEGLRDNGAAAKIAARIRYLALENVGDVKPVGEGISEMRKANRGAALRRGQEVSGEGHPEGEGASQRVEGLAMTKISNLKKFDPAEHLKTPEAIAAYLEEAIEIGDPAFIVDALGVIARSKGMTEVARSTGLGRESLYKALRKDGNPKFSTVLRVFDAVGLRLSVKPLPPVHATKRRRTKARAA